MLPCPEGAVTKLRREFKLIVPESYALALAARLTEDAAGAQPEPTRITSVYFDRPGQPLSVRARLHPEDCLKVRTKEYSPDRGSSGAARVVLEVKRERNGVTHKRRVWATRAEFRKVLRGGASLLPLIAGGTLVPVLAVTYQRHVYQGGDAWRVTIDRDIAFHPVTAELAMSGEQLTAERLGAPAFRDSQVIIEVKHLGKVLPEWLANLNPGGPAAYSKFAEGMTRLNERRAMGVTEGIQARVH